MDPIHGTCSVTFITFNIYEDGFVIFFAKFQLHSNCSIIPYEKLLNLSHMERMRATLLAVYPYFPLEDKVLYTSYQLSKKQGARANPMVSFILPGDALLIQPSIFDENNFGIHSIAGLIISSHMDGLIYRGGLSLYLFLIHSFIHSQFLYNEKLLRQS